MKSILIILLGYANFFIAQCYVSVGGYVRCGEKSRNLFLDSTIRRDSLQYFMLRKINQVRSSINMYSLVLDSSICNAAQRHAEYMAKTGIFEHSSYARSSSSYENIFRGDYNLAYFDDTESFETQIINAWLRSPPHNKNLHSYVRKAGTGVSYVQLDDCTFRIYAVFIGSEIVYK